MIPAFIKPGDFGVVRIPDGAGPWIRFGQWLNGDGYYDYEHAFVYVGNNRIIEAEPNGAREASLGSYLPPNVAWYSCPPEAGDRIASVAISLIGTPYSTVDYFALASARIGLPHLSKALRDYVESSHHMICSQLVDYSYMQAGVQLFDDGRLPGDVTPGDLYSLIRKQSGLE